MREVPVKAENKVVAETEMNIEFLHSAAEASRSAFEELAEQLENHPDNHPVYLIVGHAEVEYSGRKNDKNEG